MPSFIFFFCFFHCFYYFVYCIHFITTFTILCLVNNIFHKSWRKKNLLRLFVPFLGVLEKKEPPDLITKVLEKKEIFLEKKKLMRSFIILPSLLIHTNIGIRELMVFSLFILKNFYHKHTTLYKLT